MKSVCLLPFLGYLFLSEAMRDYSNTDIQKCLNCLCHARTGCYSRLNCARYSVSYEYWRTANSPMVSEDDEINEESYRKCMKNENCIYATLDQYAEAIGKRDCNCDGQFDCKDRFAIHLYGAECTNPKFDKNYVRRFNSCASNLGVGEMLEEEGVDGCTPEIF